MSDPGEGSPVTAGPWTTEKGGVAKTTTPVNLSPALVGGRTIVDIDSDPASSSTGWNVSVQEYLRLVSDLTALTRDPAGDLVIRGLVDAREQITDHAREAVEVCRALSKEELERLGPGRLLFSWVACLDDALSREPRDFSGRLIGAADVAGRLEAIEEAAREVGDRTTALAREFLDGTPSSRKLLAALAAVMRLRADFDLLHAAVLAGFRRQAELTTGP